MKTNAYSKLFGIGPGMFGEFFNGDPTAVIISVLKAAFIDDIGSLFAALGYDKIRTEVIRSGSEVG